MSQEFEVIGKRIPHLDSVPKVIGAAKYIRDMVLPGMLYGKFLRSPHAHARVVSIDTSQAEKLPGVKLVLTPDDVMRETHPIGLTFPKHQYCLHSEVRYVGDEVAAVAAVDEETAEEAVNLIKVEYEELPAVLDPEEAMAPGAPQLHEEPGNIREPKRVRIGNIEDGFRQADHIVKARFRTSRQAHVCLDAHGCISSYDPATGKLTHWSPAQSILFTRLDIAEALGIPASRVRVITPAIGGGFGSKAGTFTHDVAAALMSRRLGRPVKFVLSREEEFLASRTRTPFIIEAEAGLKKDGTITAWREKMVLDSGAYADMAPWVAKISLGLIAGPYKIPNVWVDCYPVYTNKSISGAFRGFGNEAVSLAREALLDIAAGQMGIDPLEIRLKNIIKAEDIPFTTSAGLVIRSCGMEECLKKAAGAIGWDKKRKPHSGVGLACMVGWSGEKSAFDVDFSSAQVEIAADGSVIVRTGNSNIGQGLYTTLAQIAAEELGVPLEMVAVVGGDTEGTPPELGCWASRSAVTTGSAVKRAASEAREKLLRVAGNMLEVDPQDLMARRGNIHVKDMSRSLSVAEVAGAAYFTSMDGDAGPVVGRGVWASQTKPQNDDGYGHFTSVYVFAAHAAEVEVDPETGLVKVTRYVTAHDCGRALNVSTVEGQLQGGASQGIGLGLFEDDTHDKTTGQPLNPSIMSDKVPTAVDLPDIEPILVETVDPLTPFGQKGVGDVALHCVAATIANAVHSATGISITDLPITPAKILRALKEKNQGEI
ncbi:MAG: molybdopterin-dependent oxidoreductase [Chloroflexi bacterium]|nr:molybdopterin-dependent oxidoreductase [Chloroflexota bacterium]